MTQLDEELISTAGQPGTVPPMATMLQLMFGKHIAYSISAVARLGVADHIGPEGATAEELAGKVGAHAPSLYRVMRMLAGAGVFEEEPGHQFRLTPVGDTLRTDSPNSLRYLATAWGDEWSTQGFANFTHAVRTGEDAITKTYGKSVFELFADIPEQAETFHHAMVNMSAIVGRSLVAAYNFSDIKRLADIGGGHGMLLTSILKHYPAMRGVLFDRPEVAAGAHANADIATLGERVQIESGDFFERIPFGCDGYVLKNIIHDWSDERCVRILQLIREQLPANGRVLICEMVVPDEPGQCPAKLLDIEMLAHTVGGKERTAAEFRDLLAAAGLTLDRVVPTDGPYCVLEARRC